MKCERHIKKERGEERKKSCNIVFADREREREKVHQG
jgi:hypothetical protein